MAFRLATAADLPALVALRSEGERDLAQHAGMEARITSLFEVWMVYELSGTILAFVRCQRADHGAGMGFDFMWFYPDLVPPMTLAKARVIVRLCKAAIVEALSRGMPTYGGRYYVEPTIPQFRTFLVNNFGAVPVGESHRLTGLLRQSDLDRIDISGVLL